MVIYVNDKNIEEEVSSKGIVVLDVYADWCGPCKMLAPVIDKLSDKVSHKVLKLDSDKNKVTVEKYGVSSLPTIIFFKDGKEIDRHIGYASLEFLLNKIEKI